ncbi:hypothetical protein VNO77_21370 [Canavalia gladiata]|uniref:Uncharacterized protein n=1 Tax=Canavalia gladiata TaxID=3824 RepID=A0AAN9LRV7_CANGL
MSLLHEEQRDFLLLGFKTLIVKVTQNKNWPSEFKVSKQGGAEGRVCCVGLDYSGQVCSMVISYQFHVDKTTWVGLWFGPLSMSMWSLSERKEDTSEEVDFVPNEKEIFKKKSE